MSALAEIVGALAGRLRTVEGLRAVEHADQITPPMGYVRLPSTINFDQTFGRGADALEFSIVVLAGPVMAPGSTDLLAEFLDPRGPRSVKAAMEVDATLGGLVDDCNVKRATTARFTFAQVDYLGAEFTVSVFT